jgi:hypothetical protein
MLRIGRAVSHCALLFLLIGCGQATPFIADPEQPIPSTSDNASANLPPLPNAANPPSEPPESGQPQSEMSGEKVFDPDGPFVWGVIGLRGFALGEQPAPNGQEFKALFAVDFDYNLWLWRSQGLYLFTDARFWGQRAAPGVTNASQGAFDFSKREYDLTGGIAWNYYGALEVRAFAYSFNNLNRGNSATKPSGYADGMGLENRWYVGGTYADLGSRTFDVSRATFLSVGYYPTKDMPDGNGDPYKPGPFVRAYLTLDLVGERCYLFGDVQLIATQGWTPKMLCLDAGMAVRPFAKIPRLEFRLGSADSFDLQLHETETTMYGAVRFVY